MAGGLSAKRLETILVARGIQGLLLPPAGGATVDWSGLDWSRFAVVRFGYSLTEPAAHLVAPDSTANADHPMINPIWRGRFAIGDVLIPLRRHDPMVAVIHGALSAHGAVYAKARRMVRLLRK